MTDSPGSKVPTRPFRKPREYHTALGYDRDIIRAALTISYPEDYLAVKRVHQDRVRALVTEMIRRGEYYGRFPLKLEDGRNAGLTILHNGTHTRWVERRDDPRKVPLIYLRGLAHIDDDPTYQSARDWTLSDSMWEHLIASWSMIRYITNLGNVVRVYPRRTQSRISLVVDRDQMPFREQLVPLIESIDTRIDVHRTLYPDWPLTRTTKDHRDNYAALEDEQEIEFGMMVRENALKSIS